MLLLQGPDEVTALLTDFGVAKPLIGGSATLTGSVLGTLHYLAPEQLEDSAHVTHFADQYSLGATLFEMLIGEPPDWKQVFAQGRRVDHDPRLARHPTELAEIIARAMSFETSDRYPSCSDVADCLRAVLAGLEPARRAP